jgi:hypothetical protein
MVASARQYCALVLYVCLAGDTWVKSRRDVRTSMTVMEDEKGWQLLTRAPASSPIVVSAGPTLRGGGGAGAPGDDLVDLVAVVERTAEVLGLRARGLGLSRSGSCRPVSGLQEMDRDSNGCLEAKSNGGDTHRLFPWRW